MSTPAEKINDYKQRKAKILEMGGAGAVEKQHQEGKWSVRERVEYFFDPGTFTEIGMFMKHRTTNFGLDKRSIPAEGVVTGFGIAPISGSILLQHGNSISIGNSLTGFFPFYQ